MIGRFSLATSMNTNINMDNLDPYLHPITDDELCYLSDKWTNSLHRYNPILCVEWWTLLLVVGELTLLWTKANRTVTVMTHIHTRGHRVPLSAAFNKTIILN